MQPLVKLLRHPFMIDSVLDETQAEISRPMEAGTDARSRPAEG